MLASRDVQASECRLADIINFPPDATFVIDKEGKVIAWNLAMEEMTDFKAEEMVGKGEHAYAVPLYGTERPMLIDLALRANNEIEAGYTMFERLGDRVIAEGSVPMLKGCPHLWGTARVLRDSLGEIAGAIESIRDVTGRKRLEESLRESERKYREIFEHSIEGRFQSSPDGRYLYVNPALARMAGYDGPEQMMGDITDIARQFYVNPEDRMQIKAIFTEQDYARAFETRLRRRDGSIAWGEITARAVRDETGTISRYEGAVADITKRKQTEEDLQESREYFAAVLNRIADPICVKDREHRWVLVNDKFCEIVGVSREDLLGKSDYDFFPKEEADVFLEKDEEVFTTCKENFSKEYLTNSATGETILLHTKKSLYRNKSGQEFIVAIGRDVTEHNRTEEALRRSEKDLTVRNRIAAVFLTIPDEDMYAEVLRIILELLESAHGACKRCHLHPPGRPDQVLELNYSRNHRLFDG
jgi:PAS domain S-box-containing protein